MGLRVAVRDDAGGSDAGPLDRSRSPAPAELFGYVAIGLVLTAVVMLSSRGYFTPDIKPEVYLNPLRRLAYDLSAWQPDPQLGVGNYNNGLAPVSAVTAALHAVGLSPELIARLLRLALLGFGAWGAVRFFRAAAPSSDVPAARLAMAAVFLFNPYAIVGGSTLAVLLPYCVFPWQLLVLLRALQGGHGWKWPSAFALTFFAMSGMNVAAVPVLQLVAMPDRRTVRPATHRTAVATATPHHRTMRPAFRPGLRLLARAIHRRVHLGQHGRFRERDSRRDLDAFVVRRGDPRTGTLADVRPQRRRAGRGLPASSPTSRTLLSLRGRSSSSSSLPSAHA